MAIVTEAASGYGKAIATRFAAEGAQVVVADIDRFSMWTAYLPWRNVSQHEPVT